MKQTCILTGEDPILKDKLINLFDGSVDFEEFDHKILHHKNWTELLGEYMDRTQPNIIIHNYKLKHMDGEDINLFMKHNYELSFLLSDYSFVNGVKLIYLSYLNDEPYKMYDWVQLINERMINQNGGVTIKVDEYNPENISNSIIFSLENFDELEFYSHDIKKLI